MNSKFYGHTSSDFAKEHYIPVQDKSNKTNITLGSNSSAILTSDAKLLGFTAAKHKFVGRMFQGFDNVLEIGCMDGFGSLLVSEFVKQLVSIDFYIPHIEQAKKYIAPNTTNVEFIGHDFLDGPVNNNFDGCFSLDVLEHIAPEQEHIFLKNVISSLNSKGVFIVGMPSLESQTYASEANRFSHINCKSGHDFSKLMEKYFHNVFSFGMNDEVLHTGFSKMSHYLINLCTGPKI